MQYMEPTSQEVRMRKDLVQRFTKLITSFNMNAVIRPVGSYITGLYLPTSDIDMVITFPLLGGYYSSRLYTLIGQIRKSGFASRIEDVLHASIPLIRITDKITGIQIDLTAADGHAVKATEAVQEWLQHSSPAKPLLFVVKMFLSIRRCGTTYTGGIDSYALFWMVVAWRWLHGGGCMEVVAWVKLEMPKEKPVISFSDLDSLTTAFGGLSMSKKNTATSSSDSDSEGVDLGELLMKFLKYQRRVIVPKHIDILAIPQHWHNVICFRYMTLQIHPSIWDRKRMVSNTSRRRSKVRTRV
jgi:non-canonical poly(A) RNA polymerase PAPD5/7